MNIRSAASFDTDKRIRQAMDEEKFHLMPGGNIQDLLSISDTHIACNVCTTTFEAKLKGIPTIELNTALSSELYDEVHLEIADYRVFSAEEAKSVIENRISSKKLRCCYYLEAISKR